MSIEVIAQHKKAYLNYDIHEKIEVGLMLQGWEVKALRLGKGQITESHAIIRQGEVYLIGIRIQPPSFASAHQTYDELRTKKLLLKKREIHRLEGMVQRQGYTLIPLKLYWKNKKIVKCELAVASGKKEYDKRQDIKEKEWQREKSRLFKHVLKKG